MIDNYDIDDTEDKDVDDFPKTRRRKAKYDKTMEMCFIAEFVELTLIECALSILLTDLIHLNTLCCSEKII